MEGGGCRGASACGEGEGEVGSGGEVVGGPGEEVPCRRHHSAAVWDTSGRGAGEWAKTDGDPGATKRETRQRGAWNFLQLSSRPPTPPESESGSENFVQESYLARYFVVPVLGFLPGLGSATRNSGRHPLPAARGQQTLRLAGCQSLPLSAADPHLPRCPSPPPNPLGEAVPGSRAARSGPTWCTPSGSPYKTGGDWREECAVARSTAPR